MKKKEVVINWRAGLHSRPASELVKIANKFKSRISIKHGDLEADAKSILSIITLGVGYKATLIIIVEGEDENEALDTIVSLFEKEI
ncbi:MAG TPA: HPr family phosphocarrier protein [Spirochaetota bacterium]|mgnify:CR=1 FL=1|nr:HPr family phosphocarrier protein [Spirochaetota bacterium]HOL57348.1 HPr family phosphocarrier protein [Spirochaetota bacterium]HPP04355.1 HPr family phosphocarrier protein [Spirochaetota bacterium]